MAKSSCGNTRDIILKSTSGKLGRLTSNYSYQEKATADTNAYPCAVSSLIPSIHDPVYYQGILSQSNNFSADSRCEIFEAGNGVGEWIDIDGDAQVAEYLQDASTGGDITLRAIFCTSHFVKGSLTTFNHRLSLSCQATKSMLNHFNVSPQFLSHLLSEPDYWAPGEFETQDSDHNLHTLEFFCQLPRWDIHHRATPWCIYMSHSIPQTCTTYLIVCGSNYKPCQAVKQRLSDAVTYSPQGQILEPFFLHTMIMHEASVECKSIITAHRRRLYDQLDKVDEYAKSQGKFERRMLEQLTIELHGVSQDTDSLLASADMAEMIASRMLKAHVRFENILRTQMQDTLTGWRNEVAKTNDGIAYLLASMQAQKRWLLSYRSRKDIAMNLVFNLVTQQDSATNTDIARETKADSSSMKTIAALTMIFLPGTFTSSVFSMNFVQNSRWWVYCAVTLPLTFLTITMW